MDLVVDIEMRIVLCALACIFVTPTAFAITPSEQQLFDTVVSINRATRQAIKTVECDYSVNLNGLDRRCKYAQKGELFYQASVDILPDGRGQPRESAWNGQWATSRADIGYLVRSAKRDRAYPSCSPPLEALDAYWAEALGILQMPERRYRLTGARRATLDDMPVIELTFEVVSHGGRLVTRHASKFGYFPVSLELYNHAGLRICELTDVEYETRNVSGNVLVFPLRFVHRTYGASGPQNTIHYWIDPQSLRLNQPIPAERFVIEPWPCDRVFTPETQQYTKAQDRNWSPIGKVGFPFSAYFEASPHLSWSPGSGLVMSPASGTGESGAAGKAENAIVQLADATSANVRTLRPSFWIALIAAGIGVTLGGVVWRWRQNKRTA